MPRRKIAAAQGVTRELGRHIAEPPAVAPVAAAFDEEPEAPTLDVPADWTLGALLNVRNQGDYIVTLFPEEYDYRRPERALRFTNVGKCQSFVSNWYARQHHDPRAW